MANALSWPSQWFDTAQQWLFEALVQPLLFALGQASVLEDAYAATGWLLVGLLQLAVMLVVIAPLERWRPVEPLRDHAAGRPRGDRGQCGRPDRLCVLRSDRKPQSLGQR